MLTTAPEVAPVVIPTVVPIIVPAVVPTIVSTIDPIISSVNLRHEHPEEKLLKILPDKENWIDDIKLNIESRLKEIEESPAYISEEQTELKEQFVNEKKALSLIKDCLSRTPIDINRAENLIIAILEDHENKSTASNGAIKGLDPSTELMLNDLKSKITEKTASKSMRGFSTKGG